MSFQTPVLTLADLPTLGNTTGDFRAVLDTGIIYRWNGASWVTQNSLINNLYYQIPGGSGDNNVDGGVPNTVYGGTITVDGGSP